MSSVPRCPCSVGLAAAVVCIALAGVMSAAQAAVSPAIEYIPVSVTDRAGSVIRNLTSRDFLIVGRGVTRVAVSAHPDPRPLSVVIVAEGVEPSAAATVRSAVRAVIGQLQQTKQSRVGLMLGPMGATVPVLVDTAAHALELEAAVEQMFWSPATAPVQELLVSAAQALSHEPDARRLILVLSSNRQAQRTPVQSDLVGALMEADVTVGTVEVTSAGPASSVVTGGTPGRFAESESVLSQLRSAAGGWYERVADVSAVPAAAARMVGSLAEAYLVGYEAIEGHTAPVRVTSPTALRLVVTAPAWPSR